MHRLKYVSRIAPGVTRREIDAIVAKSAQNNARDGLTGALLALGGLFVQILEGPVEALEQTFARIVADPRHRDLVVVRRGQVSSRLFDAWSMRLLELDPEACRRARPALAALDECAQSASLDHHRIARLDDELWRVVDRSLASAGHGGGRDHRAPPARTGSDA